MAKEIRSLRENLNKKSVYKKNILSNDVSDTENMNEISKNNKNITHDTIDESSENGKNSENDTDKDVQKTEELLENTQKILTATNYTYKINIRKLRRTL